MLQVSRTSCMLLDEDDTTYQEHQPRFLKKLLAGDSTTYQQRVASQLKKIQRVKNILQITWRKNTTYQEGRVNYLLIGKCCKCQERLACYWTKMIQHTRNINQGSWGSCDNVPTTSGKLFAEDFTTYHKRVASQLKKMLQRIKNILQITWGKNTTYQEGRANYLQVGRCCKCQERLACYWTKMIQHTRNINQGSWGSCDNVPTTSGKLFAEDFTTYHKRVASQLKKMLQRIKNILQITWGKNTTYQEGRANYLQVGRCCKYQERLACYWTKMIQHTRNINQGSWRSCDNVPATSRKLLAEDFTTYHERVANHPTKMLQHVRNILQITWIKVHITTYQEGRASYLQVGRWCKYQERFACYLTKMLVPWSWFPKPTPCPTPSVPKCPQVSPSVPKCPQVSPSVP